MYTQKKSAPAYCEQVSSDAEEIEGRKSAEVPSLTSQGADDAEEGEELREDVGVSLRTAPAIFGILIVLTKMIPL